MTSSTRSQRVAEGAVFGTKPNGLREVFGFAKTCNATRKNCNDERRLGESTF